MPGLVTLSKIKCKCYECGAEYYEEHWETSVCSDCVSKVTKVLNMKVRNYELKEVRAVQKAGRKYDYGLKTMEKLI